MASKQKLKFIDIFSGAGGLSCGLELAGLECILGIDFNQHAMDTFALNHKKAKAYCGDVTKLSNKEIDLLTGKQKINLVVGGPPCQGFSTVGPGDPEDSRNRLFLEFLRIVKHTRPEFVIIENVTGLLAKKNEKTLKAILKKFTDLGFVMDVRVLSAQNYGVAENRRRTIFIGSRVNSKIIFPSITNDPCATKTMKKPVTVGDVLSDLATKSGEVFNHNIEQAQIKSKLDLARIKRIPEGKGIRYKEDEKKYLTPKLSLGVDWLTIREGRLRQTKFQRLNRNDVSPTIMTHRHGYYHPVENRYLTQREAAKIQSFPNDFKFSGPLSAQWKQIGNAVPPLLAKALGLVIKKMQAMSKLEKISQQNKTALKNEIENIRGKAFVYR